jgi:DNA adenine methylase
MSEIQFTTPILKWVGGKTQILTKILDLFPTQINNYYEPFIGGGSILLGLLDYQKANKITISGQINAYDTNEALIYMYKNIQALPNQLYKKVNELKTKYNTELNKEDFYYQKRDEYNKVDKKTIKASALFIFLNKTCFRGIYRVGPNGFNVPFGHYKTTPKILNKTHLMQVSELIKNVKFNVMSYENTLQLPISSDFVYMDPPYFPEKKLHLLSIMVMDFH